MPVMDGDLLDDADHIVEIGFRRLALNNLPRRICSDPVRFQPPCGTARMQVYGKSFLEDGRLFRFIAVFCEIVFGGRCGRGFDSDVNWGGRFV